MFQQKYRLKWSNKNNGYFFLYISLFFLFFISPSAFAVDCPSGYHFDRKSSSCIQSNCFDITHAHYTPGGQCVCGSSGSPMENANDPNKECILPSDASCPRCVYACVQFNQLCAHEKQQQSLSVNTQKESDQECMRTCQETGPNFIGEVRDGKCHCNCAKGFELDSNKYECVMKPKNCDLSCKEYHGTSKIHGPEAEGKVVNGVCQCSCLPGYQPDKNLTCISTPYCPDGDCEQLEGEDCSWCEDCSCKGNTACRPDSDESKMNYPSDGCVKKVAEIVDFGCTKGGSYPLMMRKSGTGDRDWFEVKKGQSVAAGDVVQLSDLQCLRTAKASRAYAVFKWADKRVPFFGKAVFGGGDQIYGDIRFGKTLYESGWGEGVLERNVKYFLGSNWGSFAWNIINIKPGPTLALEAFFGRAGSKSMVLIRFKGTNIIIEPDGQGDLRFITLEGEIDLHDQYGKLIATVPEGRETTLNETLTSVGVQTYDPTTINPLWQENWLAELKAMLGIGAEKQSETNKFLAEIKAYASKQSEPPYLCNMQLLAKKLYNLMERGKNGDKVAEQQAEHLDLVFQKETHARDRFEAAKLIVESAKKLYKKALFSEDKDRYVLSGVPPTWTAEAMLIQADDILMEANNFTVCNHLKEKIIKYSDLIEKEYRKIRTYNERVTIGIPENERNSASPEKVNKQQHKQSQSETKSITTSDGEKIKIPHWGWELQAGEGIHYKITCVWMSTEINAEVGRVLRNAHNGKALLDQMKILNNCVTQEKYREGKLTINVLQQTATGMKNIAIHNSHP